MATQVDCVWEDENGEIDWLKSGEYPDKAQAFVKNNVTIDGCHTCFLNYYLHICYLFKWDVVLDINTKFFDIAQATYLRILEIYRQCTGKHNLVDCPEHRLEFVSVLNHFSRQFSDAYYDTQCNTNSKFSLYDYMFDLWNRCNPETQPHYGLTFDDNL